MNKIILTITSLLFIIVAALLVVPSFIDWNRYKDQITEQIANASGYRVQIKGDMQAAFLPYPHVRLNDVSFDSADLEGPVSFEGSMDSASVSLAFMPLVSGNVAVSDITLISPVITILEQQYTAPPSNQAEQAPIVGQDGETMTSAIQLDRFYVEKAQITYKPLQGEAMSLGVPALELQADTLFGPYVFDGQVVYNDMTVSLDGKAGQYSKTEAMPLTLSVAMDALNLAYSGIVDMSGDAMELQGEIEAGTQSIQKLALQAGTNTLPLKDQGFTIGGLLTGSAESLQLQNGTFSLGDAKGSVKLAADNLDADTKTVTMGLDFSTALDLDALMTASKISGSAAKASRTNEGGESDYRFLPETIEMPAGIKADINITAPRVIYKGQTLDTVTVNADLNGNDVAGAINIVALPGGGSVDAKASLGAESTSRNGGTGAIVFANPALSLSGDFSVQSLQTVMVDWLQLAEADMFANPRMPSMVSGAIKGRVQGRNATLSSTSLTLGEYDIRDLSMDYQNAAEPEIDLSIGNFEGATLKASGTLDQSQGVQVSLSHPNAARFLAIFNPNQDSSPALDKPFSFSGLVLKNEDIINVSEMQAKIGTIDASGTVIANMGGEVPAIDADLTFGNLDTRALMGGGQKQSAATRAGSGQSDSSARAAASPWTRDAIDTSMLRSMNLDLDAKAQQLVHGPWLVQEPVIDITVQDGVLAINSIAGTLFDGKLNLNGQVEAVEEGKPLSPKLSMNADNVDLSRLVQAALAQTQQRVNGTGSFTMDLTTSGLSSSALVYGLTGDGSIETSDLTIYGLDLAKVTEALSDESLTDLAAVIRSAFQSGQTQFLPVSHPITIREGTMPVNDFKLVSETAQIIANGEVSFARWHMDLTNTVDFIGQYDDLPSVEMTIKGPLNAPQKNVASDVLRSFIMNKYGGKVRDKIQDAIGDKLGSDSPAAGIINNLLGLPQQQKQPAQQQAPVANDNTDPTAEEPEPQPEAQPQQSPEEQLIRGLINQFGR